MIRLTLMALAGSVVLIVAGLLGQVGQLDEATAAAIQLLLIPVRLVGVFTAVAGAAAEGLFTDPQPAGTQSGSGAPWGLLASVAALAVLARVAGPHLYHLYRRETARRRKLADAKDLITEHLLDLADDIEAADLPDDRVAARQFDKAITQHKRASAALDRPVRRLEDLAPALAALRRGQAAMASARASMGGGS